MYIILISLMVDLSGKLYTCFNINSNALFANKIASFILTVVSHLFILSKSKCSVFDSVTYLCV